MAVVTAMDPPVEGGLAWKIKHEDSAAPVYEPDEVGPWTDEPDKVQWVDSDTDLDCLIVRNRWGSLCGYVGVPAGHSLYEVPYQRIDVDVHGGLTFSDKCADSDDGTGICHIPFEGRTHDIHWLGFDCGHFSDYQPGMAAMERKIMPDLAPPPYAEPGYRAHWTIERYRDLGYVMAECASLAKQIAAGPEVSAEES